MYPSTGLFPVNCKQKLNLASLRRRMHIELWKAFIIIHHDNWIQELYLRKEPSLTHNLLNVLAIFILACGKEIRFFQSSVFYSYFFTWPDMSSNWVVYWERRCNKMRARKKNLLPTGQFTLLERSLAAWQAPVFTRFTHAHVITHLGITTCVFSLVMMKIAMTKS